MAQYSYLYSNRQLLESAYKAQDNKKSGDITESIFEVDTDDTALVRYYYILFYFDFVD